MSTTLNRNEISHTWKDVPGLILSSFQCEKSLASECFANFLIDRLKQAWSVFEVGPA